MRRLRAEGDVPFALGRPGVTVRAHYGALPISAAGRGAGEGGESRWMTPNGECPVPGSYGPLAKNRRGGAP